MTPTDPLKGITGKRVGPEPENELEHFYHCQKCGQMIDMRQLDQVFHHEDPDHEPMKLQ